MTSDACCTRAGWIEYLACVGALELHVSVAPGTELGGEVRAFDHDAQEMVVLDGWMAEWHTLDGAFL